MINLNESLPPPAKEVMLSSAFVCVLAGLRKNYSTDFHKIWWKAGAYARGRGHGDLAPPSGCMIVHILRCQERPSGVLRILETFGRPGLRPRTPLGELTALRQTDMVEPVLNHWPLTRPGHWVCFELRDYLTSVCYSWMLSALKGLWSSMQHTYRTRKFPTY